MSLDRRHFLRLAATAGGAMGLAPAAAARALTAPRGSLIHVPSRIAPLKILILGGTGFIGPYQVQYALDRGHTVTLFNRGKTNPGLFPSVEKLQGDRTNDLKSLEGRDWDIVIDNSATNPEWVDAVGEAPRAAREALRLRVDAIGVRRHEPRADDERRAALLAREHEGRGGQAAALRAVEGARRGGGAEVLPEPHDRRAPGADRRPRRPHGPLHVLARAHRARRRGLAPGDGSDPVQVIDARDLSEWMIRLAEQPDVTGTYNAVGPRNPRSFEELLYGIKAVTTSDARFTWVDTDFLAAQKIRPYVEMPVWQPARNGREGFARFDLTKEIALGLTYRPLAVTAQDTLAYYHAQTPERQATLKAGVTPEREAEVLALWKARAKTGG